MTKPVIFLVHGYNGIPKIFNYFKDEFEKADYEVVLPQFPTQTEITQKRYFSVFDEYNGTWYCMTFLRQAEAKYFNLSGFF